MHFFYLITDTSHFETYDIGGIGTIKTLFGPLRFDYSGDTTNKGSGRGYGLGKIYGSVNKDSTEVDGEIQGVIARGGYVLKDHTRGVFTTDVQRTSSNAHALIGFRCVYHPPAAQ